jgi:hypothetical protein
MNKGDTSMKLGIHITMRIVYPFLFLILLFSKSAFAQSSTYNISGYCNSINQVGSITTYSDQIIDVAVQSTRAYLAASSLGLRVIDISTPSQPVEIGYYQTPEDIQQVIVNGNYAYLAPECGPSLFRILDISNPSNIAEVANVTTNSCINDMAVNNGYVFINDGSLEIYDVHNFSNITAISVNSTFSPEALAAESTYLYLVEEGEFVTNVILEVFDVSTISNITEFGSCTVDNGTDYVTGVFLGEKYLYISCSYGIYIIDKSNSQQPVVVGFYPDGYDYYQSWGYPVAENGDFLYMGDMLGVHIIDIHDPTNPVEVAYYDTPDWVLGICSQGNYLYAAAKYSGFHIFNVNTPCENVTVNVSGDTILTTTTDSTGYYEIDGLTYGNYTVTPMVADYLFYPTQQVYSGLTSDQTNQDYFGTLNIQVTIDSVPSGLTVSAYNLTTTTPFSFSIGGGSGFGVSVNSPILSFDSVTQFVFTSWSDGGAQSHTVYPSTDTTYTVNFSTQYYFLTQPFPDNGGEITPIGGWTTANTQVNFQAIPNGGFQFVNWTGDLSGNSNPQTLLMNGAKTIYANFDLVSSENFMIGGHCVRPDISENFYEVGNTLSQNESYNVKVNGNLAFLADGTAGLRIIDVSNPSNPVALGSYTTYDIVEGVDVQGNYAYIAAGSAGLQILDISNPSDPVEVGAFNNAGYAFRVVVRGNYAYLADDTCGFLIIDISNSATPYLKSSIPTNGQVIRVVISGNYAHVMEWVDEYSDPDEFSFDNFWSVDISNPSMPQVIGNYIAAGGFGIFHYYIGCTLQGNYAYLLNYLDGALTIVIDISQPTNPAEIIRYYWNPRKSVHG